MIEAALFRVGIIGRSGAKKAEGEKERKKTFKKVRNALGSCWREARFGLRIS
jgi:hypothetical protein